MNKVNKILLEKRQKYATIKSSDFKSEDELLNRSAEIMNSGADIIEFSGKTLSDQEFLRTAKKLRDLSGVFNALLVISDRIDIAKLSNADGVVLDKNSITIFDGKKLTEGHILLGYKVCGDNLPNENELNELDFVVSDSESPLQIKVFKEN